MVTAKRHKVAVWVFVLLCGLAPPPLWAALQAYVDRNPVVEDESFTLTLESDSDVDGTPDLSPLRRDFDVESQGKNSSFTMINGSISRKTQWQISLMAKRSGQLQIPPIHVGSEQSQPLTVTVTPASQAQAAPGGGDLFLDVDVKPHSAYVQQQIVYTVRLYRAVNLANNSTLSAPTLPDGDAVVEKLGKDKNFDTVRNGMRYQVTERSYAIYPQKSGDIDIAPVVFEGDIVQGGGGGGLFGFDPFNQRVRHKRLRSRAEHITVKPMPAAFHGNQWLPARSLQLDENWSPAPPKFAVGQAITRTVAIMADGLTASQLPALQGEAIPGVKQYPDQPKLKDTKDSSGVTGLRTDKIAYIATHTGKITLPAIKITWWNTATDQMEVASLPAHTYTVAPAPGGGTAATPPPVAAAQTPPPSTSQQQSSQTIAAPSLTVPAAPLPGAASAGRWWPWLASALGLGWLTTLAAWWWRARRKIVVIAPAVSAEKENLQSQRQLEKALQSSCAANDAGAAKVAMLAWARQRWSQDPPISLTMLARRCPAGLSAALIELDRVLYAQTAATWRGQELWQQFTVMQKTPAPPAQNQDVGLEPLYRSR